MEDLVEGKWIKMEQLLTEYDSRLSSSLVALKQNTYEARDMMVKTVENTLSGSSVHVQSLRTKVGYIDNTGGECRGDSIHSAERAILKCE